MAKSNWTKEPKLNDEKWLREQYFDYCKSYSQIGEDLGFSKHAIYRTFKRLGIKPRKHTAKYPKLNNKEWLKDQYLNKGKSATDIAKEVGCAKGAVHSSLRWAGAKSRSVKEGIKQKYPEGRFGERASNWKGGRRELGGYIYIYNPDHPNAAKSGCIPEHSLVMERKIGRYLEDGEMVHHIDGNKKNNNINNLLLCTKEEHTRIHFDAVKESARLKKILDEHNIKY